MRSTRFHLRAHVGDESSTTFLPGRRYFTCNAWAPLPSTMGSRSSGRGSLLKAEGGRNGCRACSA
uniref:Uncharacterized protein n=1 Tax=Brassica oleracea TaxID=3712 RepID=A0A3P6EC52_BRAOL|nr:unnamed protein product [Brassica oleracea]